MAIFSSNRISSISVDNDNLNESNNSATMDNSSTITKIIESVCENNGINLEDYKFNNFKYEGLLESMINITETNNKLFENIINYDMLNACRNNTLNESGIDKNIERDKQNMIINNTNALYSAVSSSIAEEVDVFKEKLQNFFEKDKDTFYKYSSFNEASWNDIFDPICIAFPTEYRHNITESIANIDNLAMLFTEAVESIYSADEDNILDISEEYKNRLTKLKESTLNVVEEVVEKEEWTPTNEDLDFIHQFANPSDFIDNISESAKYMIESINYMKDNIFNDNYSTNVFSNVNNMDTMKYYYINDLSTEFLKEALNRFNIYKDLVIREVANARKAMIVYGRSVIDNINERSTMDNIIVDSICESSDIYVFDNFS